MIIEDTFLQFSIKLYGVDNSLEVPCGKALLMGTTTCVFFMKTLEKLSGNYHQILLLDKFSASSDLFISFIYIDY